MLIIGEMINSCRKDVRFAIDNLDDDIIADLAIKQAEKGADYIDVHCGTYEDEAEVMEWLVNIVHESTKKPISIDSDNPETIAKILPLCKNERPIVNGICDDPSHAKIIPLIKEYNAKVIAVCIKNEEIPSEIEDRVSAGTTVYKKLLAAGIPNEDIFIDPFVKPISTDSMAGYNVLSTAHELQKDFPEANIICGISNISYGLPERYLLNKVFLSQALAIGIENFIMNPLDDAAMKTIAGFNALMGYDPFCAKYVATCKKSRLQKPESTKK
jgi:cobalamin-dependent methionine synthase I